MAFKSKIYMSVAIATLALSSCGGGSGGNTTVTPPPAADTTAPTVSFSLATLTVDSAMTGSSTLTATDNVGVTTGPTVTCTNGGSFSGSTFTAPAVTAETTSVCTATAGDAANNTGTANLTVTIRAPMTNNFTGVVYKGAISGATIRISDAVNAIDDTDAILVSGVTAADGGYDLTIPEGTAVSNLLVVGNLLAGAEMVCDAVNCASQGIQFGSPILIPADDPGAVRFLSAAVPTPAAFGTAEVNVNMFTHYQLMDMLGVSLRRPGSDGRLIISSDDYAASRQSTAKVFGLPDTDLFAIPYVDVTQPITSTDQNAIYAALLSGGLLGAALETNDPFAAVINLQNQTFSRNVIAREANDNPNIISLEDIFRNAIALAVQIGATGNAFTGAQTALSDREALIKAASADRPIDPDGTLPAVETNLTFLSDSRQFSNSITSALLSVVNPDNLVYTAVIETGPGSEFFDASFDTAQLMELSLNNSQGTVPAGVYTLNVTFDTQEGDPYTDSIEITLTSPALGVVEDSVQISKSVTDRVIVNINNPDNFQISDFIISGTGSENFFPANSGSNTLELSLSATNVVPNGTYNLTVEIQTTTVGVLGTDTLEVIVAP